MTHAWCRDVARDAAVRAAEDGRDRPLPTLEEAIAAPFACVACGGFGMDHRCRESCEECDGSGRAMFPKSVSASSPVEQENKGDGMRTERVTLEVEIERGSPPSEWPWSYILSRSDALKMRPGESVRVVDTHAEAVAESVAWEGARDAYRGRILRLTEERDAAIRERDEARQSWLRSEESGTRLLAERNAALDAADGLRKRVSALQAASGGGEGEPVAWGVEISGHVQACYFTKYWADRLAEEEKGTVVPLYREPPQPRGWLTEEERELIAGLTDDDDYTEEGQNIAKGLLTRSTPPEVVLPDADCSWCSDYATVWRECLDAVRSSLAAAGVAVKEAT